MKLLVELGNSRLKVGLYNGRFLDYLGSVSVDNIEETSLTEMFASLQQEDFESVYLCSVGDADIEFMLIEKIRESFSVYPILLNTLPRCCDIECGYDDYKSLGSDRWMAIMGATAYSDKPTIIVDAGTALTIDCVVDNKHQGGFIVPGLSLLQSSLSSGTANLQNQKMGGLPEHYLPTNTANAMAGGSMYMLASFINTAVQDLMNEVGCEFYCVGTGGDFVAVLPLLSFDFDYIEDLTLVGMTKVIESV